MTAQNLDDVAQDIIFLKTQMAEEKQKIEAITAKLGLLDHLLHDSTEIKIAVEIAATKTNKRLAVLEELLTKTEKIKKKSHTINKHVFALATKGHQRNSSHNKSLSFGQFSVSEVDNHPEFDFGQTEEEFKEITDWVVEFKKFPPVVNTRYLSMMSLRHQEEGNSSVTGPPPP